MKAKLNAQQLRIILLALLILVAVAASAGFYFIQGQMRAYASSISVLNADVDAGSENIRTLQSLQRRLKEEEAIAEKARAIVAESKEYVYQDSIVNDINKIAKLSGVSVTSFTFADESSTGTPAAGSTASPATPTAPVTPTTPTTPVTAGTVNTRSVTVALKSPTSYTNIMNFIRQIEKNPLKMQISNVSLQKDPDNAAFVVTDSFTIKVYVR